MHEWHSAGGERREGAGGSWGGGWVEAAGGGCGGGGGIGLFMMPSPINTAEVMTQIVFPLYGVTPVDLWPSLDTLGGGRCKHSVLWSSSWALLTFR